MIYNASVQGTQASKPADVEINGNAVYARANIARTTVGEGTEAIKVWTYEEAQMTLSEWQRLLVLDSSWIGSQNAATRTAERRARYERMDPLVSKRRRLIDLGIDVEENQTRLTAIQEYCKAVTDTQASPTYPAEVEYPEEPSDRAEG